jgi:hypothetical protein
MSLANLSKSWLTAALAGLMVAQPSLAQTATPERLKEVTEHGRHVMPFDLKLTQHIFTKTETGGVQQVVVRHSNDKPQIELIRQHLTKISGEFSHGDFSDPEKIHGKEMPGLATLRTAKPGQLKVVYKELDNGAEITYSSEVKVLIDAIHLWFDAQLTDHGHDAMPGMNHSSMHDMQKMHCMHK